MPLDADGLYGATLPRTTSSASSRDPPDRIEAKTTGEQPQQEKQRPNLLQGPGPSYKHQVSDGIAPEEVKEDNVDPSPVITIAHAQAVIERPLPNETRTTARNMTYCEEEQSVSGVSIGEDDVPLPRPKPRASAAAPAVARSEPNSPPAAATRPANAIDDVGTISTRDNTSKNSGDNVVAPKRFQRKVLLFLIALLAAIGIVVIAIYFAVIRGDDNDLQQPETTDMVVQVGESLYGPGGINSYFGTSLALSETGGYLAVASASTVRAYKLMVNDDSGDEEWQQLGQDIVMGESGDAKRLQLQSPELISVAMDASGLKLVTGYGSSGLWEAGLVKVFWFVQNEWIQVGQALNGTSPGDRFGTSVSMNAEGDVIAVGVPGQEGDAGYISVFQRDADGQWRQRGLPIPGEESSMVEQLGRSVSLSASGDVVAGGSLSKAGVLSGAETGGTVVKVYEFDRFGNVSWTPLGDGVLGESRTATTGWYVDLSDDTEYMVVSNTYLDEADFTREEHPDLVVQVYSFSSEHRQWIPFGERLHVATEGEPMMDHEGEHSMDHIEGEHSEGEHSEEEHSEGEHSLMVDAPNGPRSGYTVSLSGDGMSMAMGNSGVAGEGRSRGHAYILKYMDGSWNLADRNAHVHGDGDGDNLGFSVALSGDGKRFAAGAPYNRGAQSDAGQVKVYDVI